MNDLIWEKTLLSENRRRSINDRPQKTQQDRQQRTQPKTSSITRTKPTTSQRQQPQRNVQRAVGQAQSRIQQIKSPFAKDQTKTISASTRANPNAKRKLGQIPLRDRQATQQQTIQQRPQVKKAFAQRKTKSQGLTKASTTAQPKVREAFAQRNQSQDEINQIFDFSKKKEFF